VDEEKEDRPQQDGSKSAKSGPSDGPDSSSWQQRGDQPRRPPINQGGAIEPSSNYMPGPPEQPPSMDPPDLPLHLQQGRRRLHGNDQFNPGFGGISNRGFGGITPIRDRLVDAFILFNEREKVVPSIEARLTKEGITTYIWNRDIPVGDAWEEFEHNMLQSMLQSAAVILLFLGSQGWGPTHLKLASHAREAGKRIIPVLIGDPAGDAFDKLDGLFRKLRYVDLRRDEPEAFRLLLNALRPARAGQYAVLIGALIDGDEEARATVLREVMDNAALDRRALSQRLREEIENRFGPEQERNFAVAARDPKKMASIRSWMVSVLIWTDAEYAPNRQLIVKFLDRGFETDRNVRFCTLAGLHQRSTS